MSDRDADGLAGPLISSRREFLAGAAAISTIASSAMAQQQTDIQKLVASIPKLGKNPMIPKKFIVPMRDGTKLALDAYFPEGNGPWPVILQRTPYNRRVSYFIDPYGLVPDAGFVYVLQDCRGRFESEGVYRPFIDDMEDGYDTVEWLAAQPWSTGNVGMMGTSAMGITSYMAAMANPPHLKAAFVALCRNPSSMLTRFPGGVFLESGALGWNKSVGLSAEDAIVPHIATWTADDERVDMRRFYSRINIPMMHLGGWFDIHEQPLIDAFTHLQSEAAAPARGNQKLVITPTPHIGLVKGATFPGDIGAAWQSPQKAIRWFDHWLKGVDNGVNKEPAVRYYLMGDTFDQKAPGNGWREAEAWPPVSKPTSLYLGAESSLSWQKPAETAKYGYIYDPNDAVPTVGGNNLYLDSGPMDQRPVSHRQDVLRFVGEPLESPVEVVGQLKANLWVSTDAPDTDFIVKLIDIHPDGNEALVRDQGLRLRFRKGLNTQVRAEAGEIYPITIDLWSTALVFAKGHRIGILIQSSNWPRFERHTNTWDPVDGYSHAVKANNVVHVGKDHPSSIILPIMRSQA